MTFRSFNTFQKSRPAAIRHQRHSRTGTILPGLVVGLVVTIACVALVLDRLWLDAATTELRTSSEAAALAAVSELVNDHLLCEDDNIDDRMEAARQRAAEVAANNTVAGQAVDLDISPGADVRFGQLVVDPQLGITRFLETSTNPRTAVVTSKRERARGNPVALWFRGITKQGTGNAISRAQATADNQILGVRPFDRVPVPALPLAILKNDPSGLRTDTWDNQILSRNGDDKYRYNAQDGTVEEGADGIPEILLHSKTEDESATDANVQLVDLDTDLRTDPLLAQFQAGWTEDALKEFGGELVFHPGSQWMTSLAAFDWDHVAGLEALIGKPRICLLYSELQPAGDDGYGKLRADDLVAGRIMAVRHLEDGQHVLVFQPTILTTRTAVLANTVMDLDRLSAAEKQLLENPFIYKLHLTR